MAAKEKIEVNTYQENDNVVVESQKLISGTYRIRQRLKTKIITVDEAVENPNIETQKRKIFIGKKGINILYNESAEKRQLDEYKKEVVLFLKKYNLSDYDIKNLINDAELKNAINNGYSAEEFAQVLLF